MIGDMVEHDESRCERCQNTAEDVPEDEAPEWDECCEEVLCERCWFDSHVRLIY